MSSEQSTRIFVRTKATPAAGGVPEESEHLVAGIEKITLSGGAEAAWAQVCVLSVQPLGEVVEAVVLQRDPGR